MNFRADALCIQKQVSDTDWQFEPAWPGTARIDIENALVLMDGRSVGVAAQNHING